MRKPPRGYGISRNSGVPASDCTCSQQCPSLPSCACMYVYDSGYCECICSELTESVEEYPRLAPETEIRLCAREIDLAVLGWFLGSRCTAEVFIPALAADEKVSVSLERVRLDVAIREAGLVIMK